MTGNDDRKPFTDAEISRLREFMAAGDFNARDAALLRDWIAFRQFSKSASTFAKFLIWLAGGVLSIAFAWEKLWSGLLKALGK